MKGDCVVEELGHTSEVGLRLRAADAPALFACAAQALFNLLGTAPDKRELPSARPIELSAFDRESLLVDWLTELIYLHETTGLVFPDCRVETWSDTTLTAIAFGHQPAAPPTLHIKAITYHQILCRPDGDDWLAQVFLDI